MRRWSALLSLVLVATGCVANLVHGPRVEPDTEAGMFSTIVAGSNDSTARRLVVFPDIGAYLAIPLLSPEHGGSAVRLGLQASVMTGYAGDLYVQLPSGADGTVGGFGVLVQGGARRSVAPYVMLGTPIRGGIDTYVAVQVVQTTPVDTSLWSTQFAATIGARSTEGRGHIFAAAVFGQLRTGCPQGSNWCRGYAQRTRFIVGTAFAFRQRRTWREQTWPRR